MPNFEKYQKTISDELISLKDRVRDIIDSAHWAEDGRYKEIILSEVLAAKLPSTAALGTGFVMGDQLSSQIDIIVYNTNCPIIFQKINFVIVPREAVLGIIEVKTELNRRNIMETFRKAHLNGKIIGDHIFNGVFGFETEFSMNTIPQSLCKSCKSYPGYINNISFGKDFFMKYWADGMPYGETDRRYRMYHIERLSFGYFISNLIEDIQQTMNAPLPQSMTDMLYPIEGSKEVKKKFDISIA